jgi:hypothetical protein
MVLNQLANINADISEVLGEEDEGLWQEVGILKNIDTLGVISLSTLSISRPFSTPAHLLSEGFSVTPSFSSYLPGFSDSLPKV